MSVTLILELSQEIVSAGGKTIWGAPADVGTVVGGATFDVVLDNNGKDLDTVRFVSNSRNNRIIRFTVS